MTRVIVGTGDHVYEAVHPFGKLPEGMAFGNTSHVATDSSNRVYVCQRKDPPVLVFDGEGNLITTWGDGQIIDVHGVYVTSRDQIFVVDRDAHEVLEFSTEGEVVQRLGMREKPSLGGPFNHPADVAVAPSGEIFVADGYGNSRVHRFTAEGKLLDSWGSRGAGPGELSTPHGIWVDGQDRVYVCDRENDRVQVFTVDGDYLDEWGNFYHPMGIFQDAAGRFYVTDQIPSMTMLNSDGEIVTRGRTPFGGHGVWIDSRGDIYLSNNAEGITKLIKQ